MRRKDKEIKNRREIEAILHKAHICHIAMCDGDRPYLLAVNYGYDGRALYVHSAMYGKKIDIIKKNNQVSFAIETDIILQEADIPCEVSQRYRSVIGTGRALLIEDETGKRQALDIIMRQHSYDGPFDYMPVQLAKVVIIKIEIDRLCGKQSGF